MAAAGGDHEAASTPPWYKGQAADFSQCIPGPRGHAPFLLPSFHKCASGPPCTDIAGGHGDTMGQKEKGKGSD